MKNKLLAGLSLILIGSSIVWYWENAAEQHRSPMFYMLLAFFLFNTIRSVYKEEKLESKIKELKERCK